MTEEEFLAVVIERGSLALQAGMGGRWQQAADEVKRLHAATGFTGLVQVMMAWIDTALAEAGFGEYGGTVGLKFLDADTGLVARAADDIRPAPRWAGRLFAARLADDQPLFEALIEAIPREPADTGEHVMAVLQSAVLTIQRANAG